VRCNQSVCGKSIDKPVNCRVILIVHPFARQRRLYQLLAGKNHCHHGRRPPKNRRPPSAVPTYQADLDTHSALSFPIARKPSTERTPFLHTNQATPYIVVLKPSFVLYPAAARAHPPPHNRLPFLFHLRYHGKFRTPLAS